jgi:predicted dehydrogenase/threonine dehydrogenase-like Zn-dependent dehydrogenase
MRQVFLQKGAIVVKEVCQPVMEAHDVLIAVHYSFISSGTESATILQDEQNTLFSNVPTKIKKVLESVASHGIEGTAALIKSKLRGETQALGYSCSGRVLAVGDKVRSIRIGDFVACAGAGYAHHADLVCVPEHLVVKVSSTHVKEASITTIGAIALQGVRQAQLKLGETVCVIGLGLLGQLTVQLAKKSGCTVIGVDLMPERLELAMALGADRVLHPAHDNVHNEINFLTDHYGVDATIITAAAKNDTIIQQAMELTRKKGKVVLVGDVQIKFDRAPFYAKEIDFSISCSYGPGRYDPTYEQYGVDYPYAYVRWTENRNMQAFVKMLEKGDINVSMLTTHEVTLDTIAQAYASVKNQHGLGVLIAYDQHDRMTVERSQSSLDDGSVCSFIPARRDALRVGMIGAGGFAKVKLLPALAKLDNVRINAIADTDVTATLNSAKVYSAAKVCVDYKDLLSDDVVDAVVIASPHKFHAAQAIRALSKGKAVFLEKPMVTDRHQLEEMRSFLKEHKNVPFCVDYNRSFAPFMQKIKKALVKRSGPMVMHYRMNAGLISKDHWVQSEVGAGRIIGEACHIIDLFCYLTEAKVRAISVESMHSTSEHVFPTDNFSVQLSFDDGSVCSLLYTSVGHASLAKERMELFFDGKSIVMDDYRTLKGYGMYPGFDEVSACPDKGHSALLKKFFDACSLQEFVPPISYQRLDQVAEITLVIDELACQGGGARDI